mgnify:CR=1 FL=1
MTSHLWHSSCIVVVRCLILLIDLRGHLHLVILLLMLVVACVLHTDLMLLLGYATRIVLVLLMRKLSILLMLLCLLVLIPVLPVLWTPIDLLVHLLLLLLLHSELLLHTVKLEVLFRNLMLAHLSATYVVSASDQFIGQITRFVPQLQILDLLKLFF